MKSMIEACADAWRGVAGGESIADLLDGLDGPCDVPACAIPEHLSAELAAALRHCPVQLATALKAVDRSLRWRTGGAHMPASFRDRYAYVELAGPDGMIVTHGFRSGIYLQASDTVYPSHWHAAEELYLIVSGVADWQVGSHSDFVARTSGALIRHGSNEPHAMNTHRQPMLALWAWQGELDFASYRIIA